MTTTAAPQVSQHHPAGLWVLFTTEMWERFAFYGMRAILVLYLVSASTSQFAPGFGWSESDAYKLYAIYTSWVYLFPMIGGWIADRWIGQHRAVLIGAVLMALGQFALAAAEFVRIGGGVRVTAGTDPVALWTFYAGLALMVIGNGFFKPCISVMVGQLYGQNDPRRDAGFSIFYMGINIGAFVSPLVAGTIGENYGYHLGFMISGLGMIFGLCTYSFLRPRFIPNLGLPPQPVRDTDNLTDEEKAKREQRAYEQTRPLTKVDYDKMFVILILSIFSIGFWVAFEQAGSSLNTFAKDKTSRGVSDVMVRMTPELAKPVVLLDDEYLIDLANTIDGVEATEKSVIECLAPSAEVIVPVRESWNARIARLFSFRSTADVEKQPPALLFARAKELSERRWIADGIDLQVFVRQIEANAATGTSSGGDAASDAHVLNRDTELTAEKLGALSSLLTKYERQLRSLEDKRRGAEEKYVPGDVRRTFPASWYQSVNPLGIVLFTPFFAVLWVALAKRGIEPSTPVKFGMGLLLLSVGFYMMVPGAIDAHNSGGYAKPYWLVICYCFCTWGELCISPVGLSMVTKLAPVRLASLFMGVWFLCSSIAYYLAGYMAAILGADDGGDKFTLIFGKAGGMADFFFVLGTIPAVIGVIALILAPTIKRKMHGVH
ncbi:MAG: peptide MFS transporter [Thermoguttaceae bacterium]